MLGAAAGAILGLFFGFGILIGPVLGARRVKSSVANGSSLPVGRLGALIGNVAALLELLIALAMVGWSWLPLRNHLASCARCGIREQAVADYDEVLA